MNADFPRILSLLRKERQLSQKQVATDLDIAQALLSHYEKGKRECGLDFLVKAANYYNVSTDYLLGRSAVSSGTFIVESDISEDGGKSKNELGSLSAALTKKLIISSIEVIYSLVAKSKDSKLIMNISNIFSLTVYRAFRLIHKSNSSNDRQFFGISEEMAFRCTDAGISVCEGSVLKHINENENIIPQITTQSLELEYQKQATALLNLVKNSEAYLKEFEPK